MPDYSSLLSGLANAIGAVPPRTPAQKGQTPLQAIDDPSNWSQGVMPVLPSASGLSAITQGLKDVYSPVAETLGETMAEFTPRGGEELYNIGKRAAQGVVDPLESAYQTVRAKLSGGGGGRPPAQWGTFNPPPWKGFPPTSPEAELATKLSPYGEGAVMPSAARPSELDLSKIRVR